MEEDPDFQPDGNDDDDDDMANLFSFGSSDEAVGTDGAAAPAPPSSSSSSPNNISTLVPGGAANDREQTDSPDSFLEMLNAETSNEAGGVLGGSVGSFVVDPSQHDKETQDLLDWLENEGDTEQIVFDDMLTSNNVTSAPVPSVEQEEEPPSWAAEAPSSAPPPPEQPTVVALPPTFESFQEALSSNESTVEQVRNLFVKEQQLAEEGEPAGRELLQGTQRAELYCRMVCHKSLEATGTSSLADSFEQWKKTQSAESIEQEQDIYAAMIRQEQLGNRIAQQTGREAAECETDLIQLVQYHLHQNKSVSTTISSSSGNGEAAPKDEEEKDVLLPAVAAVILSAGIPVSAAAVVLSQIIPNFMPLLALPPETEQWEAALLLHNEFYLLACYHVPLLVFHLDRHLPGWYWPKLPDHLQEQGGADSAVRIGRNLKRHGQVPPSWLLSHLSGECCGGTMLPMETILMVWDGILTAQNNASRFFLALAVLEQHASTLLLLTGPELVAALQKMWSLEDVDQNKEPEERDWMHEWWPRARALQESTPDSALDRLKRVEDEAIQQTLVRRQERKEAALQARLEAEAAAHREAQERKAEEARLRLSRARLVAFYRKHAPEKEENIDKIMDVYKGRLDVLDEKLRMKYNEGFDPSLKPKPPKRPSKLLATMSQGMGRAKSNASDDDGGAGETGRRPDKVSLMVTAAEVLPVVCWSREAKAARGHDRTRRKRDKSIKHLKFYLVDSRSEEAAQEQGRFPTAERLSPEAMMDPERLKQNEEKFEALRGAVHIVIMGEGFNALPKLYNQRLTPKLEELMEQDESRTNLCALFFHKLGLPFVSVLDGGFAAAHSWLVREGPANHLDARAVLVDYNPDNSLFGQLETLHNASASEKAQRKMANLLEASVVTMTRRAQQLERLTSDLEGKKPTFKNPFAGMGKRDDAGSTTEKAEGKAEAPSDNGSASTPLTAEASQPAAPPIPSEMSAADETTTSLPPASKPKEEKANPFKGLGAALSSAAANPKRNPWAARFGGGGGGGSKQQVAQPEGAPIRSFNSFRRTTMSRFGRSSSKEEVTAGGDDNKEEEGSKSAASADDTTTTTN